MFKVLIVGAGKIGATIAGFLQQSGDYEVHLTDINFNNPDIGLLLKVYPNIITHTINVTDEKEFNSYVKSQQFQAIISSLPFYLNVGVATAAKSNNIHYFDLTEDNTVTASIKNLAQAAQVAFVPQCGIAPGFISIVASSLMQKFSKLESACLRAGALPQATNNSLHYALTWSIDGLINEYLNPCYAISDGKQLDLPALENLEPLQFDGKYYEAFNTSGGLGSLTASYAGKINTLNYKTIRYLGHCEKFKFLLHELNLKHDKDTLIKILTNAIPQSHQDLVLIYVLVTGYQNNKFTTTHYLKKIYPQKISGINWTAIQIATASGVCAVVDFVLNNPAKYNGLVLQEQFALEDFLNNRFGIYFA